eukprot:gene686-8938_t
MEVIQIPIRYSDEVVDIEVQKLPDVDTLMHILLEELAPLEIWIKLAVVYYNQGNIEPFKYILNEIIDEGIKERYIDYKEARIKAYNILAAYDLELAITTENEQQKSEYYSNISQLLATANLEDQAQPITFVTRGIMYLQLQKYDLALTQFNTALISDEKNLQALIGKASVLFHQKQYSNSLRCFSEALTSNPDCPSDVRFGIGLCYYKLNNVKKARLSFERVIQLEPTVDAYVGLAILDLNSDKKDRVMTAMNYLKKAFQMDQQNSMVLNHLANHFFYKNDLEKVQTLASNAFKNSKVPEIKGEAFYYLGRLYHHQQMYEQSFNYYSQVSNQYWPDFTLGHFTLGQMYIQRDEIEKAISEFQKVAKAYPENFETQKILGSLYGKKLNIKKALTHLKNANLLNKEDEEVLIEIGELDKSDFNSSLESFKSAAFLMEKKEKNVPFELWNNIGSLQLKLGQYDEGYENLMKALDGTTSTIEEFSSEHVCIVYNIAGYFEKSNPKKSKEIYKQILKIHPTYLDAILRLAYISFEEKKMKEAIEWCEIGKKIKPNDSAAYTLQGTIYLKNKEWSKAQEMFESVLKNVDKNDIYSNLSLGSLYFSFAKPELKEKEKKNLNYSIAYFQRILQQNTNNVHAANGLGAIIATQGYLENAKDILLKCRETTSEIPEIWLNLAHIFVCSKEYNQAIKLYESCLKKFYENKNIEILIFIAKTHYLANELKESKIYLQKALKLDPNNYQLWYNLGIIHMDVTNSLLKKKTVSDATEALENIKLSISHFKFLDSKSISSQFKNLKKLLETTKKLLKESQDNLEKQIKIEKKLTQERKLQEDSIIKELEEKKQKKLEEERKKKEAEEAKLQRAIETQKKFEQVQKSWLMEEQERMTSPQKEKRKKKKITEEEIVQEEEEEKVMEEPKEVNDEEEADYFPEDQIEGEAEVKFDGDVSTTPKPKKLQRKQKRKRDLDDNEQEEDQEQEKKSEEGKKTPKKKQKK